MFADKWRGFLDTILLGVVGALSAQAFTWALKLVQALFLTRLIGYQEPGLPNEPGGAVPAIGPHHLWLIPVATTLGGLISGVLVYSFAPEAEGHGTDTAVRAYHRAAGAIRPRVVPLKMITSAITVGSGGSAGREGPTALFSAGLGSLYGTLRKRSDDERRLLLLVGMAAGLAAIFRSPIGSALFAVEVLYSDVDFEGGALIYAMIGSIVAYAVNGLFVGWAPLFRVPALQPTPFAGYFRYMALGLCCGLVATVIPVAFYRMRDAFHAIPIPPHLKPALGGLGLGLLAMRLPNVLGGGYGWIQQAIDGRLALHLMIALAAAKLLAFTLTVSSGGSGGVFAPSLYIGAMVGGSLAIGLHEPPAAFAVIGMAATFGAAGRVPIATLLMVAEMTGGYELLVPAALAVMLSAMVQALLSVHLRLRYPTLYEAQVSSRADSPVHAAEYVEVALRLIQGHEVQIPPSTSHIWLRDLLAAGLPVDVAGGQQFMLGAVSPRSPLVGRPLARAFEDVPRRQIFALFREGQTLLADPNVTVRQGDRLLILAPADARDRIRRDMAPPGRRTPA